MICTNCENFRGVDRDEEAPCIEATLCAYPGCTVYLCKGGCEHLSFACDACGLRFCESHGLNFAGHRLCIACSAEGLEMEPDCTCRQTDVDLFDPRACEYHNSSSVWNVRRRAVSAVQEYEATMREIA